MPRKPKSPGQIAFEEECRQMHKQMVKDFRNTENKEEIPTEELLALVLSYSLRKCDCRKLTSELLEQYISFPNLVNHRAEILATNDSIPEHTALLLKQVPGMIMKRELEKRPKRKRIKTPEDARTYLFPYFIGYNFEQAYLLILKDNLYPKDVVLLGEGSGGEVYIDKTRILREVLVRKCTKAILAHSHPGSEVFPSINDKIATIEISRMFRPIEMQLLDHLIFARDECYFLSRDEEMDKTILAFSAKEPGSIFD